MDSEKKVQKMKLNKNHKRKIITNLMLLIILLTGLFLRLYNIEAKSLWVDEESSIKFATKPLTSLIKYAEKETHPPLYYIILHYWINQFGDSETSVRFLSLIFGVIAIFFMYKVGELLFNRETGLLSSLILAISEFHIQHSQEARMYSFMALLTLISIYFFIKMLQEKKIKTTIFYVFFSALLMYSHIYGMFIIAMQNIYAITMLILARKDIKITFKRWMIIQIILLIIFIPWIIVLANQVMGMKIGEFVNINWIEKPTITDLLKTFEVYTYYNPPLLVLFSILALSSLVNFDKIKGKINRKYFLKSAGDYKRGIKIFELKNNYFLILWLFIPIIMPFVISLVALPIYAGKYTIAASFAFYILAARGVSRIKNMNIKITAIAIIVVLCLICVNYYYKDKGSEPWRDVAGYIDKNAEKNDLAILIPHFTKESFQRYSKRDDIEVVGQRKIIDSDPERVWFIIRNQEFNETIKNYDMAEKEKYGDLIIYLFKRSS